MTDPVEPESSPEDSIRSRLALARELLEERRADDAKAAFFQILEESSWNEDARSGLREALQQGSDLGKLPREGPFVELAPPGREGEKEAHEAVLAALGTALPACPGARAARYWVTLRAPAKGDRLQGQVGVKVVDVRGLPLGNEEASFVARQHTEHGATGIEVKVEREASSAVTTAVRRLALTAVAARGRTLGSEAEVLWAPHPSSPYGFVLALRAGHELEFIMPFREH
ncbi:hypothetical protein HY251_20970 [bacterium]|nr:hypothetical protein [bacterium]